MQMIKEEIEELSVEGNELQDINLLILLVSRLAQLLGREVDMLEQMKIKEIAKLQPEKIALVDALEKQKKLIARRPEILYELSDDMRDNLAELLHIFDAVAQENHNKLLVAKEVNQIVVDAIMDTANENLKNGLYTDKGLHAGENAMALSLNRTI
jgi:hypothetical protein